MKKIKKLGQLIDMASSKAFINRGKPFKEIAVKWQLIVGQTIWMKTIPVRITYKKFSDKNIPGNLIIKSDPAFALELQHIQDKLIEKINSFLGYNAIGSITLLQAPIPKKTSQKNYFRPKNPDNYEKILIKKTEHLKSEDLSLALARLGETALGSKINK
ncbi:MAG: hypothetical protein CFH01_00531 [Alphaproteobacteria bacterium MarineAlpha2_Bin1]|nr:MAG: hypothetical protein CFH01_00531 [Alphaproteobacteria bacterium MarineAlpha2_Bin1]